MLAQSKKSTLLTLTLSLSLLLIACGRPAANGTSTDLTTNAKDPFATFDDPLPAQPAPQTKSANPAIPSAIPSAQNEDSAPVAPEQIDPQENTLLDELHPEHADSSAAPAATPAPSNSAGAPTAPAPLQNPNETTPIVPGPSPAVPKATPRPQLPPTVRPAPTQPAPLPTATPVNRQQTPPAPTSPAPTSPAPTAPAPTAPRPPVAAPTPPPRPITPPQPARPAPAPAPTAPRPGKPALLTPVRGFWEGRAADGATWTSYTKTALETLGITLLRSAPPADIQSFCPNYGNLDLRGREDFWVKLISAIAKAESAYKPSAKYTENFRNSANELVVSRGLLQISLESARAYGCPVNSDDDLNNPKLNLECGVMILQRWVQRDNLISGEDLRGRWLGGSRYWGTLRTYDNQFAVLKQLVRQSAACRGS